MSLGDGPGGGEALLARFEAEGAAANRSTDQVRAAMPGSAWVQSPLTLVPRGVCVCVCVCVCVQRVLGDAQSGSPKRKHLTPAHLWDNNNNATSAHAPRDEAAPATTDGGVASGDGVSADDIVVDNVASDGDSGEGAADGAHPAANAAEANGDSAGLLVDGDGDGDGDGVSDGDGDGDGDGDESGDTGSDEAVATAAAAAAAAAASTAADASAHRSSDDSGTHTARSSDKDASVDSNDGGGDSNSDSGSERGGSKNGSPPSTQSDEEPQPAADGGDGAADRKVVARGSTADDYGTALVSALLTFVSHQPPPRLCCQLVRCARRSDCCLRVVGVTCVCGVLVASLLAACWSGRAAVMKSSSAYPRSMMPSSSRR